MNDTDGWLTMGWCIARLACRRAHLLAHAAEGAAGGEEVEDDEHGGRIDAAAREDAPLVGLRGALAEGQQHLHQRNGLELLHRC